MVDNLKILKNLFSELEKPLFLGDGLNNGEFHVLMQPGQFISTSLKQAANSQDMLIQSDLVDSIIDTKFIYSPTGGNISEEYEFLMQSAALPYEEVSDEDKKEIDRLNDWLLNNFSTYTVFEKYYFSAADAYDQEANKENPSTTKLQILFQRKNKALNDWLTIGKKIEYENKQARIVYLSSGDPSSLWNQYRTTLQNNQQIASNNQYYQTFLEPPVSTWGTSGQWSTFEKRIDESDIYNYSKTTSWGGGGGFGWGLFSFGAGASGGSSVKHDKSETGSVSVRFEYSRIRIIRPWMNENIFGYRWWWWRKQFGYKLYSDGGNLNIPKPDRPIGNMPFIPRHMIVVRNLEIIANFTKNDQKIIESHMSASVKFGWGPFSAKGTYSEATGEKTVKGSFDGTTLRVDQPQIIAFTGPLLPLCPNPDRTLPWQDDIAPFDPPEAFVEDEKQLRRDEWDYEASMIALEDYKQEIKAQFDAEIEKANLKFFESEDD